MRLGIPWQVMAFCLRSHMTALFKTLLVAWFYVLKDCQRITLLQPLPVCFCRAWTARFKDQQSLASLLRIAFLCLGAAGYCAIPATCCVLHLAHHDYSAWSSNSASKRLPCKTATLRLAASRSYQTPSKRGRRNKLLLLNERICSNFSREHWFIYHYRAIISFGFKFKAFSQFERAFPKK